MYITYHTNPSIQWLNHFIYWVHGKKQYLSSLTNTLSNSQKSSEKLKTIYQQLSAFQQDVDHMRGAFFDNRNSVAQRSELDRLIHRRYELDEQLQQFIDDHLTRQADHASDNRSLQPLGKYSHERLIDERNNPVPIGKHTLPPLPYSYDALEPYIDEKTMRLHHDKHHKSYVDGLNKAEIELQKARQSENFSLIKHWEREAAFHGAGHYLHTIFWDVMSPKGGGEPKGAIEKEINHTFGSFEKFKKHFSAAAEKVEGVGWALLVWSPRSHRLEILQAEKHQNLSQQDTVPLLVLDVWEHAYYLKYQNNRRNYIDAWWKTVDWDSVNDRFKEARKLRWKPF